MSHFTTIAAVASEITVVVAFIAMLVKPIRKKVFQDKEVRQGQLCLLRAEIVRVYYRNLDTKTIRQYEYENLCLLYKAYKALGGNSFVDHIFKEIEEWTVIA